MDQQTMLFAATTFVLVGTMVVWGVAWWRGRGRE